MLIYVRIERERIIRIDPNLAQDIDLDDYYASTQYLPNLAHKSFEEHADVLNSFFWACRGAKRTTLFPTIILSSLDKN